MITVQILKHLREDRGVEMIANNVEIRQVDDSVYLVPSQTEKGEAYQVVNVGEEWECECPDFYHKIRYMTRLQGGWFDLYDYTLSTLPIKRVNSKDEKQIVDLVEEIIEKKQQIVSVKGTLESTYTLIASSGASMCRAGLSRLVGKREGGDEKIERVQQKGSTLVFNRGSTTKLKCVSEEAATFIKEILKECFEKIKGERLNDILSKLEFPEDDAALRTVLKHRKKIESRVQRLYGRFSELREELDVEIATLYGLSKNEYSLLKQVSYLISTTLE